MAAATFAPVLGHLFDARRGAGDFRSSTASRTGSTGHPRADPAAMTAIGASHRVRLRRRSPEILLRLMEAGGVFYRQRLGRRLRCSPKSALREASRGYLPSRHMNAWDWPRRAS